MQISNVNVPFPNTVAPFSSVAAQAGAGVTKDIIRSAFSPLNETSGLSSSQNSLSENSIVYSPESLVSSSFAGQGSNKNTPPDESVIPENTQSIRPEQDGSPDGGGCG